MLLHNPDVKRVLNERMHMTSDRMSGGPTAHAVASPGTPEFSLGYGAGAMVPGITENHRVLGPVGSLITGLGKKHLQSATGGALLGAAAGAGAGLATGRNVGNTAALGAGLGGAGLWLLSALMESRNNPMMKTSAFYGLGDHSDIQFIQSRLYGDGEMSGSEKSLLMSLIPRLDSQEAASLAALLRTSLGAGAGYIIAKYLLGLGLGGSTLMALVGGLAGFRSGPRNAFGQRVDTQRDAFGRRYLVQ